MELRRYVQTVSPHVLQRVVLEGEVPLTEFVAEIVTLTDLALDLDDRSARGRIGPRDDAEISRRLHACLTELDERTLTDQRLWQWMTTVPFRSYTAARWIPDLEEQPDLLQKPSVQKRYLGGSSLNGVSRNALARLFWCADVLWTTDDGYRFSDIVLGNQDFYQGLFERTLGLHAPLVSVLAEVLVSADEVERRLTLRNLNHVMTTITVEALDREELGRLVESCRP